MKDLKDLLGLALDDDAPGGMHAGPVAVEDDLARGRLLLRRRTRRRMVAGSAAVTVVAIAAIVPTLASGPAAVSKTSANANTKPAAARIKLVDYTGTQPPGYTVKMIPDNWVIQGSTPFALTIAPANASDKDPDSFIGKLVILQEAFDTSEVQGFMKTEVQGHVAYYGVDDSIASLVIEQTPSRWLDVQAPASLHWTEHQEAQFGAGVTILATAQEGKG